MSQKNIYIKKIINCLVVLCISAYNMQPEDKNLQACHALSLARITKKNSWESNFPIQYAGSTDWVGFNPNKQKNSITNNCDILTVKQAFLSSLRYFRQAKEGSNLAEIQTDPRYYNIISTGKVEGASIGLTFLLMHFLQDLKMTSTTKKVFAATGCLNDEKSLEIASVGGIVEKHEALINFLESSEAEEIYFFYPKENDYELLEKGEGITYYPIEDAKELEKNLKLIAPGLGKEIMEILNPTICEAMPYIEDSFYKEYLDRLLSKIEKKYQKKTMLALCNAYNDYRHSIKKDQSSEIKKKMLKFLAEHHIPLSDKCKIIDIISKGDLNLDRDDITELLSFAIKNEDVVLYNFLVFILESNPEFLQEYIANLIEDKTNFLLKVKNAKNIDDLINTSLAEETFDCDSIKTFLCKLKEFCIIETRSKDDEQNRYVYSAKNFIEKRLKKEKKQDLLAFLNWQITNENYNNQYSLLPIVMSSMFENYIEKESTINWILKTNSLLASNIIKFFASKKVPLKKKLEFLNNVNKNILKDYTSYSSFCHKKALDELSSSKEGQKRYLEIIIDQNAPQINTTILALVYGFFNYTNQKEIQNNVKAIVDNFKKMDSCEISFISSYGDKKFVAFLESEEKKHQEKNRAEKG